MGVHVRSTKKLDKQSMSEVQSFVNKALIKYFAENQGTRKEKYR
jgi:hypothetical protein